MKRLVIICRPSYRQTLFVFGSGRLVLQLTEKPLRGFVERLSDGKPCQLAHYMEWRGTARGESVH